MQLIQRALELLLVMIAGSMAIVSATGNAQKVTIRTAVPNEAKLLTSTINDAYVDYRRFNRGGGQRCNPDGSKVQGLMKTPNNVFLIAEEGCCDGTKRILGCIHVDWSGRTIDGSDRRGFLASIAMLSVLKEFRRRGIGELLVKAAESRCREEIGREYCMELVVLSNMRGVISWYQTRGYELGRAIPFPAPEFLSERYQDLFMQILTKTIT